MHDRRHTRHSRFRIAGGAPGIAAVRFPLLVTARAPRVGYDKAAEIARAAHRDGASLKDAAVRSGHGTANQFDESVQPEAMTKPGGP
jgi:fumarate hydratase class II